MWLAFERGHGSRAPGRARGLGAASAARFFETAEGESELVGLTWCIRTRGGKRGRTCLSKNQTRKVACRSRCPHHISCPRRPHSLC